MHWPAWLVPLLRPFADAVVVQQNGRLVENLLAAKGEIDVLRSENRVLWDRMEAAELARDDAVRARWARVD